MRMIYPMIAIKPDRMITAPRLLYLADTRTPTPIEDAARAYGGTVILNRRYELPSIAGIRDSQLSLPTLEPKSSNDRRLPINKRLELQ